MHPPDGRRRLPQRLSDANLKGMLYLGGILTVLGVITIALVIVRGW